MRLCTTGLIVVALGFGVVADVAAQSRVVAPIIIQRPAGATGATETRVYTQGTPRPAATPAAPGRGTSFGTSPGSVQEIRVLRPGSAGGQAPAASGSAPTGFFTAPQTSTEIRVVTPGSAPSAADPAAPKSFHTSPTQSHEIRIFGDGVAIETPVVIVPE